MKRGKVVIVEGIIGAGKSSFSKELAYELGNDTLYLQEPDEKNNANPYLANFYSEPSRWAYTMQTHLLQARYKMHLHAQWYAMTTGQDAVLDRSYFGDTAFARLQLAMGDMTKDEFETYQSIYHAMTASVLLPTACVHLQVEPEVAQQRIARRMQEQTGRSCEDAIDIQYLKDLKTEEEKVVKTLEAQGVRVLTVDWNEDRNDPILRQDMIKGIATYIQDYQPPGDMFLDLHRRTI
jgi:deoxyadenosine/deoxycytidine kinase